MASNYDALRVSGSVQGSFKCTWIVKNFSSLDSGVGKCHRSDTFRLQDGGVEWYLSLYPGGETKNSKGYVSCFAYVISEMKNVQLKYDISLCDTNDKVLLTLKSDEWVNLMTRGYGNSNTVEAQNLQSKLIDDTLVVCLDLTYCTTYIKDSECIHQWTETTPILNVVDDLRKLWIIKANTADSWTHSYGIPFHSSVVGVRSAYFAKNQSTLRNGYGCSTPTELQGFENDTMNYFMEFIYTGNVQRMNFHLALQLLRASKILEVNDLKSFCSNYLISIINDYNVCEALVKADEFNAEKLRSHAMKYLCKNISEEDFEAKSSIFDQRPELVRDILKEFEKKKENSKLST